jgi:hypothetical protein
VAQTRPRFDVPTALLIGLGTADEHACCAVLDEAAFNVCRAQESASAASRISTIMPHVVVIPEGLSSAERALVAEPAVAVGAEVVSLESGLEPQALRSLLREACDRALKRWR